MQDREMGVHGPQEDHTAEGASGANREDPAGEARMESSEEATAGVTQEAQAETAQDIQAVESKKPGKKSLGREILEWVLVVVVAVTAALLIRTFLFEPVRVDGESMLNTLHDNEYMIVTKYQYLFDDPQRFDVVICHFPERGKTNFVKRVVGIPGDTVAVRDGTLYVNGEPQEEPYIDNRPTYTMPDVTLGTNEYFVLGDNRPHSNDSHLIGPLLRDEIMGQVRLVVWPLSEIRRIE